MELANIQQFLEVYRKKLFAEEDERKSILDAIARVCGITLNEKEITVNKNTIIIQSDSVTRSHLFIYKTKILEEIKNTTNIKIFEIQ